jgi:hypothetical protein
VVGHEGEGECTGDSDAGRELFCEEIDHGDGEGSEDQRNNSEVSFGLGKGVEEMGKDKEKGGMKVSRVILIKIYVGFEVIP